MYNPQTGMFDANQTMPEQGIPTHPVGKFPAQIIQTEVKATKENTGHMLCVMYATPAGKIEQRFNFWNTSAQAVEIAGKQFSALCWATGVFNTNINNGAPELRGANLQIEVAKQRNSDYNEVAHVYTKDGLEPGRAAQQPMQQQAPMQPNVAPQQQWVQPGPQAPVGPQPNTFAPGPGQQPLQQQPGGGWPQPNTAPGPQPMQQQAPGPAPGPQPQTWQPNPNAAAAQPNWAAPGPNAAPGPSAAQVWPGPR